MDVVRKLVGVGVPVEIVSRIKRHRLDEKIDELRKNAEFLVDLPEEDIIGRGPDRFAEPDEPLTVIWPAPEFLELEFCAAKIRKDVAQKARRLFVGDDAGRNHKRWLIWIE